MQLQLSTLVSHHTRMARTSRSGTTPSSLTFLERSWGFGGLRVRCIPSQCDFCMFFERLRLYILAFASCMTITMLISYHGLHTQDCSAIATQGPDEDVNTLPASYSQLPSWRLAIKRLKEEHRLADRFTAAEDDRENYRLASCSHSGRAVSRRL
jgi:hypothetical protein